MERSDKDLIDWLEANSHGVDHSTGRDEPWVVWTGSRDGLSFRQAGGATWREAVSAAMSASEAGEIEAAKTAYWTSGWELTKEHQMGGPVRDMPSYFIWICNGYTADTPEQAVLKAYRASKGK